MAKVYGHFITVNYRESYGIFACSGILFNHESPRRGQEFVTRKITDAVARIKLGLQDEAAPGQPRRASATGASPATTSTAMWLMLQQDEPDDYVVATGETHSVRRVRRAGLRHASASTGSDHVEVDEALFRPAEVDSLVGDASQGRDVLGWKPDVTFEDLVDMMVDADMQHVAEEVRSGAGSKPRMTSIR